MNKEQFLKEKKEFELHAIIAFEELIKLTKEQDCDISKIIIASFYGIIARMKNFTKTEGNSVLTLMTALQNGMYQMANELNNRIEESKAHKEDEQE